MKGKKKKRARRVAVPETAGGGHDLFVRRMLGTIENVVSQLKTSLPSEVIEHAEWSSARLRSATQVSAGLTERRGDVICEFLLDGMPAYACALIEHQSRPDPLMAYRVMGYRMGIWEEYIRDNPTTSWLPPVYALVFYTGADGRVWTAATDVMDMHGLDPRLREASQSFVTPGRYQLVDIAGTDPQQLMVSRLNPQMTITWVLTRRAKVDNNVLDRLEMLFDHLVAIGASTDAQEVFEAILSYIYRNWDIEPQRVEPIMVRVGTAAKEATVTTAERLRAEGRAEVMSAAERFRAEGRAEGRAEVMSAAERFRAEGEVKGRLDGERQSLLNQLEFKFGPIPADVVATVNTADSDQLSIWTRRILTADSLAETWQM